MTSPTPKGEKMTPEQRGNAIWRNIIRVTEFIENIDPSIPNHLRQWIISEIAAAKDAAREEVVDRHGDIVVDVIVKAHDEGYARGFSDAVKKAAKTAESTWADIPQEIWDEGFEPSWMHTLEIATENIRALRPSGSGEEK